MTVEYEHHERRMYREALDCDDDEYAALLMAMAEAGNVYDTDDHCHMDSGGHHLPGRVCGRPQDSGGKP